MKTLAEQVAQLEAELAKLKANMNKPTPFIPKINERYWCVISEGSVAYFLYSGHKSDQDRLDFGNVYRTKHEAQKVADQRLAEVRVLRKLREYEGDWVADWSNTCQKKYHPYIIHKSKTIQSAYALSSQHAPSNLYSTEKVWNRIIAEMTEDVKTMMGWESE